MKNGIILERVSKRYGGKAVLSGFDLALPEGGRTCLMGPSGSGKTTLVRLLAGLEKPDAGRVASIRPLSLVFQEDRLLAHLSALNNLRFVCGKAREPEARALLGALGLDEAGDKPVCRFSGGMQRRVALARALLFPFSLLLLDEPFKGLDREMRQTAAELILSRCEGKTLLMVSHDEEEAALLGAEIIRLPSANSSTGAPSQ